MPPLPLAPCFGVVGGTPTSSSSFSPPPQPSASWLSLWPFPPLPFLPSELHTQPDVTSPLPLVEAGAATPPCVSAVFLTTIFQESQCHFVKYWKGWEEDMMIQKQEQKTFFSVYVLLT